MKYSKLFLLSAAFTFPFMTLVVAGLSIYLANRNEIAFDLSEIILPLSLFFLVIAAIVFLSLLSVRRFLLVSAILTGIVVGLSLAVWVQSQLLLWNFGQFNGQRIAWEKWRASMYIDGAVWLVIMVVVVFGFFRRKHSFEKALVTGIYFLGLISVFISFLNAPDRIESKTDDSNYADIFTFHPENNVLIILLDDFQSDYFGSISKKYPDDIKELDGFTFYENTISRFPTTKASIPSIMTGALFRNQQPYYKYISESNEKFNLIREYKNKSWSTSFVGQIKGTEPDFISMWKVAHKMNNAYFYQAFNYVDYCAFRALPTFLKPGIYNDGKWFFIYYLQRKYPPDEHRADLLFLELLEKHASVSTAKKGSFKFFHFFTPHAPFCLNENLQFDPALSGENGYFVQARGAIRLLSRILMTLKKNGIYDHSEIIVMSDHGTGSLSALNRRNVYYDAVNQIPASVQSSSLALLMHKPAHSKGKLTTSDVPLELTDLPCLLGLRPNDSICREFDLALSGGKRERTFYYYEWRHEYWLSEYLPPMTEYLVNGPAKNPESYFPGKFIYSEEGIEPIPSPVYSFYTLGKEIVFSAHGNATPYILAGWSPAESDHQWSDGPVAGLSFHLKQVSQKDLKLQLLGMGYSGKSKTIFQVVTIVVNGTSVGRWVMKDPGWYEAVIPNHLISSGTINLVFRFSHPMEPHEAEGTGDFRKLGMFICRLVIKEV